MKKKPPPGATLIARLKEQRLAREQALLDKSNEDSKASAVSSTAPPAALEVSPELETTGKGKTTGSDGGDSLRLKATNNKQQHLTTIIDAEPNPEAKKRGASGKPYGGAADLIQREINIDDLRPTTDDYFVLTDEIRLAGRFAAVGLIAQGLRLARLKDDALYKEHYPTFDQYCRKEHQMSATYAYRLIRMAEMAERIAEKGARAYPISQDMPDPFEVMLGLGHRHLMALLPLSPETADELLVQGIPLANALESGSERVPISRATERQIRQALREFTPADARTSAVKVVAKKSLATEKQLIPALSKLVEMLEDWSLWLGGDPPPELEAARMGRGPLLTKLAKRFRTASQRIADALAAEEKE